MTAPQHNELPTPPHTRTRRRLYAAITLIGFLLFIVGCGLGWTSYSDNPPLFDLGVLVFVPIGGIAFLLFGIIWRNSRPSATAPPVSPAPPSLRNGTP